MDKQAKLLALLAAKWKQYPQLRLCQLIVNAMPTKYGNDPYNLTDEQLMQALKEYNP